MDCAMYFSITVYSPWARKTMKTTDFFPPKTRWLTTKTPINVGTLGLMMVFYLLPIHLLGPQGYHRSLQGGGPCFLQGQNVDRNGLVVGVANSSPPQKKVGGDGGVCFCVSNSRNIYSEKHHHDDHHHHHLLLLLFLPFFLWQLPVFFPINCNSQCNCFWRWKHFQKVFKQFIPVRVSRTEFL